MNSSFLNKKILVIGASSSIGVSIFKFDIKKKLIGTYYKNKKKNLFKYDPSKNKISEVIDLDRISLVVLLHGITKNAECVKNKKKSNFVNITLNKKIINELVRLKKPFIFFSTEWVYPGTKKFNSENNKVNPVNLYARQKLVIEKFIKKKSKKYFILRIAKTYTNIKSDNSFLNKWNKMINKKIRNFKCYKDQYYSPVFSKDIYRFILFAEKIKNYGIYNFGGSERFSRLHCLKTFLKFKKVKNFHIAEQFVPKHLPKDVSFNIKKLGKIKFKTSKFKNNLYEIYKPKKKHA